MELFESQLPNGNAQTTNHYLQQWFAPQALKELVTYRDLIETGKYEYTDLLKIILSRSARSARLVTHFDLDFPKSPQVTPYWCYKHSRMCEPTKVACKFLDRYSIDTINRISEFAKIRTNASWNIIHGDSKAIRYPSVDGLITSPPYVGLIDYHRQHEYAYQLFSLEDRSEAEIGPATNGSSQKAVEQYKAEIIAVFQNCLKSIKKGGRLIVIAGDKRNLYNDISKEIGVKTEAVIQRHVNRRTGRRTSNFYESVFIWRAP